MSYIVVIEWDGDKPPNTYYNRLRKMGLIVRGKDPQKEMSPLQRRAMKEGAVIAQEGAIITASRSLAREVAALASEEGARSVQISEGDPVDYFMDAADVQVMNRVEAIYGRRGRPSGEKTKWVVTCMEEGKTYPAENEEYAVINCPYCRGLVTRSRQGEPDIWKFPDSGDVFDGWMRHRFTHGEFEVPEEGGNEPPAKVIITHKLEAATVEIMRNSARFQEQISKLPRNTAAKICDTVLCARLHSPLEVRKDRRLRACIYLFERGVNPADVSMIEKANEVDILEAGAIIGSQQAAQLWLSVNGG